MTYEAWRISYQSSEQAARAAYAECERLRAKVAEIERQEPVFWWRPCSDGTYEGPLHNNSIERVRKLSGAWSPLYALPGAQPAPSVPEDVMRDAERYRYLRARDDGTAGVGCWIEADGRACDRGWLYGVQLDSAIDSCIEVLAAAPKPEAKP